jgi:hypothetical protein
VSGADLLPLLARLPAQCQELKQVAQKLPHAIFAGNAAEKRRGPLTLVGDSPVSSGT